MSRQTKTLILLFFISMLLDVALSPLRAISFMISSVASFIAFFLLVWLFCRKRKDIKPWKILLAVFLGWAPINLGVTVLYFNSSLVSRPDALMHILGMVSGFLFYIANRNWKWVVAACGAAMCILIFPATCKWLHYLNYGTFSGRVERAVTQPLRVRESDGNERVIGGDGKVYVLDFWTIWCGICFREFPAFEKFAQEYSGREDIAFLAVGIPTHGGTDEEMFAKFHEYSSRSFPVVIAGNVDFDNNSFGITGVPTVIVLDRLGNMVFRGTTEGAKNTVRQLLE